MAVPSAAAMLRSNYEGKCMHDYISTHIHTYIHTYTNIHRHTHTHTHTQTHTHTHTHTHRCNDSALLHEQRGCDTFEHHTGGKHTHTHIHTRAHTQTHKHTHTHTHTYTGIGSYERSNSGKRRKEHCQQ
jgi:hypothetical protein